MRLSILGRLILYHMCSKYFLLYRHLSVNIFVLSLAVQNYLIFMESESSDFSLKTFWFPVLLKKVSSLKG